MNKLRYFIRKIILENKQSFLKDLLNHPDWFEGSSAVKTNKNFMYKEGRRAGRVVKKIWAKHVDRAFVDSLIYVHYTDPTDFKYGDTAKYFIPGGSKDEISCEAFDDERLVRYKSFHGSMGLIIQGHVTLLANDENKVYTSSSKYYDMELPNLKNTSGINKGVTEYIADTYVLDKESFVRPRSEASRNEALLDNWKVVAVLCDDRRQRSSLKKFLQEEGYDVPVLDPSVDDLSSYTNKVHYEQSLYI